MNIEQIMQEIKSLGRSQGYWERLYEQLSAMEKYQPDEWKLTVQRLEAEKFDTVMDMILYFEEGKHCHAKYWKIPVTWEAYGLVEIPGDTIEEALKNYSKIEDEIGLPDEWSYVDGTFKLSDDNPEELKAMIEMINK